jgi:hypothetical protein
MNIAIPNLVSEEYCYETIRGLRWSEGVILNGI